MRIGVDVTCWANGRGYGRFTRHLVPAMVAAAPNDEFLCFADPRAARAFAVPGSNVRLIEVAQGRSPTEAAAADGYRAPSDMMRLSRAVWREAPGVFFSPSVYSYFPLPPRMRAVVTVHDTIAERFPKLTLPTARARLFWRLKVALALTQARLVLTVSDYAAREIAEVLRVAPARIRVAGEAPADAFRPGTPAESLAAAARHGVPAQGAWLTYVGGFNPHKRVDVLLRAHAALVRARGDAPHLLLVGSLDQDVFHSRRAELAALVASLGTADLVHWTGFVPDEELRHLHAGALALVLPSASEGFGLPAVEAAACGSPVVATTASPLPELLEGGGLFVPPGDEAALVAALTRLVTEPELGPALGRRARQRAAALSWHHGAVAALDALREAAA